MVNKAIHLIQAARSNGVFVSVANDQLSIKYSKEKNIEPELLEEIKNNKELIIDFLNNKKLNSKPFAPENQIGLIKRDSTQQLPLSFNQERLWFIDRLEGSLQYHIPAVWRLRGNLNKQALAKALQGIVNRHEVLHTVFPEKENQAYQCITSADGWRLEMVEGSKYNNDRSSLQQYIDELIDQPFNLSQDYMLRAHLIELNEQEHVLVIAMHHIASDGWSISIFVKELAAFYKSYVEEKQLELLPLELQYVDYALWQRHYLQGELFDNKISYWKEQLQGVAPLQLPTDYPRPPIQSTKGASFAYVIDKELTEQLQLFSQQHRATLFMTLLTAFKVLLYRYSNEEDICVGSAISDRPYQEVEELIGFFINTLVLRSKVSGDASFIDLLQQVRTTTLEAYEHQEVPFEKVVEVALKERDMSRSPLFQVMFMMQNTPRVKEVDMGEVQLLQEEAIFNRTKCDISFFVTETPHGLKGVVEYSTSLFSKDSIHRMTDHFKTLLDSIVKAPQQKIGELRMLTPEEELQLLYEFNNTKVEYPKEKTIVDLFEAQAASTPEAIAVVFEEEQLTYKQLNERANRLAHYLISKGVKEETLVPICIERSIEMIVGILGILKSGGAYVPVDPEYPQERISYMLEDIGATIAVSSKDIRSKLQIPEGIEVIELDTGWKVMSNQSAENLQINIEPHHLAYVIYTSGSTGKPKGVMIEHKSIVNYLLNSKTSYINEKENGSGSFIHLSYTFDASLTAMFMPLLSGKSVILGSKQGLEVFEDSNLYKYAPYDFIKITPLHLELLRPTLENINGDWLTKKLVIGGEALHFSQFSYLVEKGIDVEIINEYGPTEATVGCSTYGFKTLGDNEGLRNNIPIGKPIDNTQLYIVDESNGLLPVGVAGEMCIGGAGLARGYLNHPGLTAEKFIANPFGIDAGSRLYKTGDLGRWLADGSIEYLGRKDDQVKIRGYRIELGEIESVLQQSEVVVQAVVLARADINGNKRLIGYVVPNGIFNKEAIITYLKSKLPDYMIPGLWVEVEKLPLTSNGKIDRKALPDPEVGALSGKEYVPPGNEVEENLAAIWQELLGVDKVGIHDNFFELGGHSLLAMKMGSYIERDLLMSIPINVLFQFSTISDLGKYLEIQASTNNKNKNKTIFTLVDV